MIKMPSFADPANLVVADDPPKVTEPLDLDALRYLQAVYRGEIEAEGARMRAAIAALPFETPKLSVVASVNDPEAFALRLERAIQRSGVSLVIEHQPRQVLEPPPPSDVSGPMSGTDRKFRRL
jgi:hypothetical protein